MHPAKVLNRPVFPWNYWTEGLLIIGFWTFLFLLEVAQDAFNLRGPEGLTQAELTRSGLEYLIWLLVTPFAFWLTHRFNLQQGAWRRDFAIHLLVTIVITFSAQAYSHYSYIAFILQDGASFPSYLDGIRAFRFIDELMLYLFVTAAGFARNYFHQYRRNLEETLELRTESALLKTQLIEARLQALRMQLNPHFLFNTLNAVSILAERDPAGVRKIITRLSDLLRYTLDEENAQEVSLSQEMHFLDSYFEIQKVRFQGQLDVITTISEESLRALIPSLILQPIAENAIKHGISKIVGKGVIEIGAMCKEGELVLSIKDNGPGIAPTNGVSTSNGTGKIGLRNTRTRLAELYGDSAQLTLETPSEGGTLAIITLPYHTSDDLAAVAA